MISSEGIQNFGFIGHRFIVYVSALEYAATELLLSKAVHKFATFYLLACLLIRTLIRTAIIII